MGKFELTLSSDYVPDWTVADAIRELFQNAIDQEAEKPDNAMSWTYEADTLRICSATSSLTTNSLLLGSSTKRSGTAFIGQFGEGYKLASMVLLRNGKGVTIYNYGAREIWRPRLVKSKRYNAEILTFFTEKHIWSKPPDNDLTIEVTDLRADEWEQQIVPTNLYLQDPPKIAATTHLGDILETEQHAGKVYVGGLLVCKYDAYAYGYNFKPGLLKLDRDRKLASDFDLQWLASRLWCCAAQPDMIAALAARGLADVAYTASMTHLHDSASETFDAALRHFRQVHGPNAIPVTSQGEADKLNSRYKAVYVPSVYRDLIVSSSEYEEPEYEDEAAPLRLWWETYKSYLPAEAQEAFEALMDAQGIW